MSKIHVKTIKKPSKVYLENLILEMENLIKTKEFMPNSAIEFNIDNLYYRIYFHNVGSNLDSPLHEYRVTIRNTEKYLDNLCTKNCKIEKIKLIIENNYDPIWKEDFYYYPLNHNKSYFTGKDVRIDYLFKKTWFLDNEDSICLK